MKIKKYTNQEATLITIMLVVTVLVLLLPNQFVMSIIKSLGILGLPFKYVATNLMGVGGIIRIILLVVVDGLGCSRCVQLHKIIKHLRAKDRLY